MRRLGLRKRKAGVEDSLDDETGSERRERKAREEFEDAMLGLTRWFGWVALAVAVALGVTIFGLVENGKMHGGLIWIALVGLFAAAAIAGLCWQRRRDLRRQIN